MIRSQDNTAQDRTGDNLSSTLAEVEGKELLEHKSNKVQVEYESGSELVHSYRLEGLQSQDTLEEMVDYVPDVKGHATSKKESVVEPKSYVAVEDLPLPYDKSCSKEDKSTTVSLEEATNPIAMNLPPAITSFTRDQIISKNCSLSFVK